MNLLVFWVKFTIFDWLLLVLLHILGWKNPGLMVAVKLDQKITDENGSYDANLELLPLAEQ